MGQKLRKYPHEITNTTGLGVGNFLSCKLLECDFFFPSMDATPQS